MGWRSRGVEGAGRVGLVSPPCSQTHAQAVLLRLHCSRAPLAPGVRCWTAVLPVSQVAGLPDPVVGLGSPVAWQCLISFLVYKNDGALLPGTGDSSPDDKLQISVPGSHPRGQWLSILCTKADRDPVQNGRESLQLCFHLLRRDRHRLPLGIRS